MQKTLLWSILALVPALAGPAAAGERIVRLDPQTTEVSFALPATGHDVHGLLSLREGEVRFDPETGKASGVITIDATLANTGNKKRDKTMHAKVLESERFPLFRFSASRVTGELADDGTSELELTGTLTIHGAEHPLTMPIAVKTSNGRFEATTSFPIPYVDWGMKNPSILILRVAKVVDVTVETSGSLADGGAASASSGMR